MPVGRAVRGPSGHGRGVSRIERKAELTDHPKSRYCYQFEDQARPKGVSSCNDFFRYSGHFDRRRSALGRSVLKLTECAVGRHCGWFDKIMKGVG
ncbi:MAG: hypothetical protein D6753_11720 [Planctomycetota bacterium]|nr:MAG: hypothetical protein D6753_11720 [Planctomycetota bacterium]